MTPPEQGREAAGRNGFTLIELLIVMVVIGILAAIAVPKLNVTREKAYKTTLQSDLKNLANSQEVYFNFHFTYQSDLATLHTPVSQGVDITVNEATRGGWAATAVHQGLGTHQCGVYFGDAAQAGGSPSTTAGVIACTF